MRKLRHSQGLMSGWGVSKAARGARGCLLPSLGLGPAPSSGVAAPWHARVCSEAEALQLDGAGVSEPQLLTALASGL